MDPSLKVEGADKGKYDRCHVAGKGVFWMYTYGQVRSFGMHTNNWKSFLSKSHSCWFLVMYTRSEITSEFDPKHPWTGNTDAHLKKLRTSGETVQKMLRRVASELHPSGSASNLAYLIVNQPNRTHEHHRAAVLLGRAVAGLHCIPRGAGDVIAVTRPDIVFTNAVNVPRMAAAMEKVPSVLMPHHFAALSSKDPSEMLVFGPRRFWEASCAYSPREINSSMFYVKKTAETNCLQRRGSCGYFAPLLIYTAYALGVMPFFYFQPLLLGLHRISGDYTSTVVMKRVAAPLPHADSTVRAALDLTEGARCVVGETSACSYEGSQLERSGFKPPVSPCWGRTKFVGIKPGKAGMWVCTQPADISKGCPAGQH